MGGRREWKCWIVRIGAAVVGMWKYTVCEYEGMMWKGGGNEVGKRKGSFSRGFWKKGWVAARGRVGA